MMLDSLLKLSEVQAVTTTAVSTNTIDLSQARDMGPGTGLFAVFGVDQTVTAAGAATVTFEVIASANSDLSSPTVVVSSGPIGKADLVAGGRLINLAIPPVGPNLPNLGRRYLGVRYTVATGPLTAGAFTCHITDTPAHVQKSYPSGFTVL